MFKFKRSKAMYVSKVASPFASHIRGMVTLALGLNLITPFAAPIPKSLDICMLYIYINNYKYIFIFIYIYWINLYIYIYIYYNPYNYDHKPTLLPLFCDTAVQHNSTGPKQGRQAGEVHVICGRSKNYRSCAYAGA